MSRPAPHALADYPHQRIITTRWADNDAYGHVNNVIHYAYFDTVVNSYLIEHGVLDIATSPIVGFVVETGCHYFAPLTYPETVTAALRVSQLGRTSVRYEIALFGEKSEIAAAQGHFVHVYVERATRRPVDLPTALRLALRPLEVSAAAD